MDANTFYLDEAVCATVGMVWSEPGFSDLPRKGVSSVRKFVDDCQLLAKMALDSSFREAAEKLTASLSGSPLQHIMSEKCYLTTLPGRMYTRELKVDRALLKYEFDPLATRIRIDGRPWQLAMCPVLIGSKRRGQVPIFSLWLTMVARPPQVEDFHATMDEIINVHRNLNGRGHEVLSQLCGNIRDYIHGMRDYDPARAALVQFPAIPPQTIYLFDLNEGDLLDYTPAITGDIPVISGPVSVNIPYSPSKLEAAERQKRFTAKHVLYDPERYWEGKDEVMLDLAPAIAGLKQFKILANATIGQDRLGKDNISVRLLKSRYETTCISIVKGESTADGTPSPFDATFGFCAGTHSPSWGISSEGKYQAVPDWVPIENWHP